MDRMREKLQAAGEGAKRLGEVANWKLELSDARARLRDAYRDLGQAIAQRWLDAGEDDARRDDHAYKGFLDAVERAREAVAALEQRLLQSPPPVEHLSTLGVDAARIVVVTLDQLVSEALEGLNLLLLRGDGTVKVLVFLH